MSFDLEAVRAQFPALALSDNGMRRIYFDNPAGTQVPSVVANAVSDCLLNTNANLGGYFATAVAADAVVLSAREAMADFINAPSADEIIFGQNMTTMTLHLSRSIGRLLQAGDEIIVSQMDHDANVWPWVLLAQDLDLEVKWLPFSAETYEFDLQVLDELISERTRLVCVGGASNLIGTINDVKTICAKARAAGAMSFIDGVQSAPHIATDVQDMGCDFFVCSSYKFFGPHQGILWGRRDVMQQLQPYKVRPSPAELPWCFETGTQSHEGIAGITATIDYFASIGSSMASEYASEWSQFSGRRRDVHAAMSLLFDYEKELASHLIDGLTSIAGITVQGVTAVDAYDRRVPTVSFTHASVAPDVVAEALAHQNIFVWSGHNYAVEAVKVLGIHESGGTIRVGPVHYNSKSEIDELLEALGPILAT
jgi:cysteine desulfurase family protein (TIGR01976 family)